MFPLSRGTTAGEPARQTDHASAARRGRATAPSLYIVDALNFLFRAYHALPPLTTTKGVHTGAIYGLCQMLLRIEREQRPTHLCAVFDAPGRELPPPDLQRLQSGPSAHAARTGGAARAGARRHRCVRYPDPGVPGFEADDVIATVARQAAAADMEVVICSSDKDLMQLCDEDSRSSTR